MPFNAAWLIAAIGLILALLTWTKSKRAGPAIGVFAGGIIIMVMADPSMLNTMAGVVKGLIQTAIDQGINN